MNCPINHTDFRPGGGVPNTAQFFIRAVDRRVAAGPLDGATLTITIVNPMGEVVLLERAFPRWWTPPTRACANVWLILPALFGPLYAGSAEGDGTP